MVTGNKRAAMQSGMQAVQMFIQSKTQGPGNPDAIKKQREIRTAMADVIQFSGCRDSQTSADGKSFWSSVYWRYHWPVIMLAVVVIQLSMEGCSHDPLLLLYFARTAKIGGEATGAMSWAFREAYANGGKNQSYVELLGNIRKLLYGKYTQIPQMSTGHRMDMNTTFNM